ncbi:Ccdc130 protein [Allomyces macrogynus ATCC 38327]|uniref:Ccdc130 protein n=1 Tax=Allomyces macrogynus (strain ATCC 38327) TaxID=578462 RepID=A0A0L0STS9_ALLM3|nr:Ccdc130 protein [Allomyces macrogynus ATCC 38327]|eukprot:KNE65896.1 Ccdc130 protein [Allomyces macrogynus ATCC 38327]
MRARCISMTSPRRRVSGQTPLFKLEHATLDQQQRAKIASDELEELKEKRDALWGDPYAKNQELRSKFWEDKKKRQVLAKEVTEIQDRVGTTIPILPEAPEDAAEARLILTDATRDRVAAKVEQRKAQSSTKSTSSSGSSKSSAPLRFQGLAQEVKRAQGK